MFCCLQRIKDWAVKMRKPEVPYSTIEECARHADIIGVCFGLGGATHVMTCGRMCTVQSLVVPLPTNIRPLTAR